MDKTITKQLVAIGGGEIRNKPSETLAIDKKIIELTGKETTNVLFIPTASNDSESYTHLFTQYFEDLNCHVETLKLIDSTESKRERETRIKTADIIYVGGGNTVSMLNIWKATGVDIILKDAYEKGTILCGLSAGAVCWFRNYLSDALKLDDPEAPLTLFDGLNYFPYTVCPHFNSESERQIPFKKVLENCDHIGLGIDNAAAIHLKENSLSVFSAHKSAGVWACFWDQDRYYQIPLQQNREYQYSELSDMKTEVSSC
ncbi:MAG: peptidase E [Spirochaetales bacterium]|nr:peptidase E [Spirochaetales bacterium]